MNDDKQYIQILTKLAVIEANQNQTNDHLKMLNGKVISHEDKLVLFQISEREMMTAITGLSNEHKAQKEERNKIKWMFYERVFYILLFLGYLVLQKTGIVNF